jgi:hypothetical protein
MTQKGTYSSKSRLIVIVLVAILLIVIGAFALIIWQGSKPPHSSTTENNAADTQAIAAIPLDSHVLVSMSAGEVIFVPGDMTVFIPAGAVDRAGKVILTRREADLLSEVGEPGWRRPYVVNIEYQDANGNAITDQVIKKPIEVCFILDNELWGKYLDGVPFQVEVYDEAKDPPVWAPLPFYAYQNHYQICGTTMHFSLFALAVKDVVVTEPTPTNAPGLYNP